MRKKRISRAIVARAFRDRRAAIIFSYGAFGLWGICCMIGNEAFYYDCHTFHVNSLSQYLEETPQDVIVRRVADTLNDKTRMSPTDRRFFMDAFTSMDTIKADEDVMIMKLPKRDKYKRNVKEKRTRRK